MRRFIRAGRPNPASSPEAQRPASGPSGFLVPDDEERAGDDRPAPSFGYQSEPLKIQPDVHANPEQADLGIDAIVWFVAGVTVGDTDAEQADERISTVIVVHALVVEDAEVVDANESVVAVAGLLALVLVARVHREQNACAIEADVKARALGV